MKNKVKEYFLVFGGSILLNVILSSIIVLDHESGVTNVGGIILAIYGSIITVILLEFIIFIKEWEKVNSINNKAISLLGQFAESDLLLDEMTNILKEDLSFDKRIKKEDKTHINELHLIIFKLKIKDYYASHFQVSTNEKSVLKIPAFYFENKIWEKFIDRSRCYLSLQLLNEDQFEYYKKNKKRFNSELAFLKRKISDENYTKIQKLFVIPDKYFDDKYKIKYITDDEKEMKDYLKEWHDKFAEDSEIFPIKVIKLNSTEAAHGIVVKDIGIFGDVYGVQAIKKYDDDDEIFNIDDKLRIDFYFDKKKTDRQKKIFTNIMKEAKFISDVLE